MPISGQVERKCGIVTLQLIVGLYAAGGVNGVLSLIIGALLFLVIIMMTLDIETRKRSLEEIDALSTTH